MRKARIPKPPADLSEGSKAFWRTVTRGWELDAHHFALLQIACKSWDRASEAATAVATEGPYFTDRHGNRKAHPGIAIELQARKMFVACLRELGLDVQAPEAPRAPALPHYRPAEKENRQGRVC
jgi:phage terminase small subunit